jgi:hypothetical protein
MVEKIMSSDNSKPDKKIGEFDEKSLREIAKEIVVRRTAVRIHWIVYVLVNLFLVVLNYMIDKFETPWCLWPIAGWFIGLAIHTFNYETYKHGALKTGRGALLSYHIFTAVIVSVFIIFVDYMTGYTLDWWYWAVVPLLVSVVIHFFIYQSSKPKKNEDTRKSYMDRQIEKEMKKLGDK